MKSLLRQIIILSLLGAAAWFGYLKYGEVDAGSSGAAENTRGRGGPVAVEVETARMEAISEVFEAVGSTRALQSIAIVPLASGRLVALNIEPGTAVAEGTVLARLDDDIEKANLLEARSKLDEASAAVDRARALRRNNTVTEATLNQLLSTQAVARAEVDRARRRLADRAIIAPFAGQVGLRQVDIGARVDSNTVITTLDDLSEAIVEFSAPESLFGRVTTQTEISARTAALPGRVFKGRVKVIDSRIDPTARAFKVRANVPNADRALPSGMFIVLDAVLGTRTALVVPEEAVTVEGTDSYVFVVSEGKAARKSVKLGTRRLGRIEILEGLKDGDQVVTRGVQRLRNGSEVKLIGDATRPAAEKPAEPKAAKPAEGQG